MIRKIVKYTNSKLRIPSLEAQSNQNLKKLMIDMLDTLRACGGVGLAAPQIGVQKRVVLIMPPKKKYYFMINPKILEINGVEEKSIEACLSIPNQNGTVLRNNEILVEYADKDFESRRGIATDFEAFIIQHEIDHLDGILFIDKLQ